MNKRIEVNLSEQRLEAYEGNELVRECACITGDADDSPTEPGSFKILHKAHPYRSKKYDKPMDYACFFTEDGKALHQTHIPLASLMVPALSAMKKIFPDQIGSHGCVRLDEEDAGWIFEWAPVGTPVIIKEA